LNIATQCLFPNGTDLVIQRAHHSRNPAMCCKSLLPQN